MAVVGYVRVSTQKQDTDNQKGEIERWSQFHRTPVERYVSETVSSQYVERTIFDLVKGLEEGDVLVVSELSRIGRSMVEISGIIDHIVRHKIRFVVIRENIDLRDEDPMSMFGIHIMGAFAQLERSMISRRTKEAIQSKKEAGISVGRPAGSRNKSAKLDGKENAIRKYLDMGMKVAEIARVLGVSRPTLYGKLDEMGV